MCATNHDENATTQKTRWHLLLGSLLKELLTPLNISVQIDVCVTSDPKADIILMQRDGPHWSEAPKALLTDGLRDTSATHLLIEFKYTESLSEASFIQILGYDQFYLKGQGLKRHELQSFLISSKTSTSGILERLGFEATLKKGVYASKAPLVHSLRVILLNELSDTPNNAVLKCFASRHKEWRRAFATIKYNRLFETSFYLKRLIFGLWRILMKEVVEDPEIVGYTPEYVMQVGQEWIDSIQEEWIQHIRETTPVEEVLKCYKPEEVLKCYKPEDRLAGLGIHERMTGLAEQEMILVSEQKNKAATILTRLLQHHFGDLPAWVQDKIALEEWTLRFVDAHTLEDLFAQT